MKCFTATATERRRRALTARASRTPSEPSSALSSAVRRARPALCSEGVEKILSSVNSCNMTVRELEKWCKKYPHKDAEVFLCRDWDQVEDGVLTDLYALNDVCDQLNVVDVGLDFKDEYEVIMVFEGL